MSGSLTLGLIDNAALLLALSIIYEISYIFKIRNKWLSQAVSGVLIGLIGVAIMLCSYELAPGVYFDARSMLIGVAALIFGPLPASIAAVIALVYRLILGGTGALAGGLMIISAYALGLVWRRFVETKKTPARLVKLYIFGICVHITTLASSILMPLDIAAVMMRQIAIPVLVAYPVGTVLLSLLLLQQADYATTKIEAAEADARYKSLFYNNHAVMLLIDPVSGAIVDASPAAVRFYGWPEQELKSMNISQINTLPPDELKAEMEKSITYKRNYFLFRHNRAEGGPVDVEVHSGPIDFAGKRLLYSIVHDISDRTGALKALQDSETRFRTLVDNAPDTIFLISNHKIVYVNKAGVKLLSMSSADALIGLTGLSFVREDYRAEASSQWSRLHTGNMRPTPTERIYVRQDGTEVHVEVMVVPILYNDVITDIVFARDITERRRLRQKEKEMEAQLRQQQKLEAIGTLASGVAHEINNPLNGVMNYAQLILDRSRKDPDTVEYASEIIHETERISTIVRNLLQFSRHEKQSHSFASIYDIVGQTVSLVRTIIKKDQIILDIELDDGLPEIKCRSQQIQQVIMNLLTNARDAVNARYPGHDDNKRILLSCSEITDDGRRWLRLTVTDNGCGIQPENRDRVYEPFFSTKPKELGTGLGMSISYGIVSEHHGKISFESEVGAYTRFTLDLPVDNGWELEEQKEAAL